MHCNVENLKFCCQPRLSTLTWWRFGKQASCLVNPHPALPYSYACHNRHVQTGFALCAITQNQGAQHAGCVLQQHKLCAWHALWQRSHCIECIISRLPCHGASGAAEQAVVHWLYIQTFAAAGSPCPSLLQDTPSLARDELQAQLDHSALYTVQLYKACLSP